MATIKIPIEDLRRHPGARPLNDESLAGLADSIAEVGLINAIRVRRHGDGYQVVAGHHRFAACDSLGWTEIDATVVDDDDLHAELAMIDENLCRAELSPADRAKQTARRKAIYLELHPETGRGGDHKSTNYQTGEFDRTPTFIASTAIATDRSVQAVYRDVQRGEKIIDEVVDLIRGTKLDTGTYLDRLKGLRPNEQVTAAKRDLAFERSKADQPRQGGIAGRVEQKRAPTYEDMRAAILLLRELTADDMARICPPAKRAAMCQQLSALIITFEQVKEGAST